MMTHETSPIGHVMIITLTILLHRDASYADPRAQIIKLICGTHPQHNIDVYVPNFFSSMDNVSLQVRTSGFGLAGSGQGPDAGYGFAQCYGDIPLTDCALCYAEARTNVPRCHPAAGARIYLDGCFLRYDNYSFFHEYLGPNDQVACGVRTRADSVFQESAKKAILEAASAASRKTGFGWAHVRPGKGESNSAYVLAECWRTLEARACEACLGNASVAVSGCLPASEGRALNTGCFMRYSDTNFLNPMPGNGNLRKVVAVAVAAITATAAVIGAVIGFYSWKKRTIQKKRKGDAEKIIKDLIDRNLHFKYSTVEKATDSFNEANKLGQGGFGTVYKGVLSDGREIAVKRLFLDTKHRASEFYNEVNIISKIEHKNLVRLLGCSGLGPESLIVLEYLPNKSLDRFIFDSKRGRSLNWEKRMKIIIGIAEGLEYLHEKSQPKIIHRDIKASNILLDSKLCAKIADFGLVRSLQDDKSHISTAIAGTLGYLAPEYLARGQLTEKADVYSFGVLLIEIVTGIQNNGSQNSEFIDSMLSRAWKHFKLRTVEELIDPNLMLGNYTSNNNDFKDEISRVLQVGLLCSQEVASRRPSMSMALAMLVGQQHLPTPTSPPFVDELTMPLYEDSGPILGHSNATTSQSIFLPR